MARGVPTRQIENDMRIRSNRPLVTCAIAVIVAVLLSGCAAARAAADDALRAGGRIADNLGQVADDARTVPIARGEVKRGIDDYLASREWTDLKASAASAGDAAGEIACGMGIDDVYDAPIAVSSEFADVAARYSDPVRSDANAVSAAVGRASSGGDYASAAAGVAAFIDLYCAVP